MDENPATTARGSGPGSPPDQPTLPLDLPVDVPIPFALTARARREVAPDALPDLAVVPREPGPAPHPAPSRPVDGRVGGRADRRTDRRVDGRVDGLGDRPGDGALDDVADTRPARARALRRAGLRPAAIADQLDVDELAVLAWVGERVAPVAVAGRRAAAGVAASAVAETAPAPSVAGTAALATRTHDAAEAQRRAALALQQASALQEARQRLSRDPGFAAGLGLLAGLGDVDDHAVTVTTGRPEVAERLVRWLQEHADVAPGRFRVVLRLGPGVAGDVARHRWADALGLERSQVVHTRWRGAPASDAEEALLRVPDEGIAATVGGWCDALLAPTPDAPF
jgi:hypothetical protein